MGSNWSLQDAKNKFSAVVEAAQEAPQTVTKHGKPAAVLVSFAEYERLVRGGERKPTFAEVLLSIPPAKDGEEALFDRTPVLEREFDF